MNRKRCKKSGKAIYLRGEAAMICERRNAVKGHPGTIYLCGHCEGWHVTKQARWPLDKSKVQR